MNIGIVGGSFDPIHLGHLVIGEEAYRSLELARVIFVPTHIQPHKRNQHHADAKHRLAMVRAAVRGCPYFEASDMELRREGVSYTVDTLKELKRSVGARARLFFIVGTDTLPELPTWKNVREVASLCTFAVAARPGKGLSRIDALAKVIGRDAVRRMRRAVLQIPQIGISSTDIRKRVRSGRSVRYLVPKAVAAYIQRHRLYRG